MPVSLLILPRYHGYEDHIVKAVKSLGHEVYLIAEKPAMLMKQWVHKLPLRFRQTLTHRYILKQIELQNTPIKVDNLLLIRGEYFTPDLVKDIYKRTNPSHTHLHQWDKINTIPSAIPLTPFFDHCTTYSQQDADNYPPFTYKANFYLPAFEQPVINMPRHYKFCFVGVLYGKRLQIIKNLRKIFDDKKWSLYQHILITRLGFIKRKIMQGSKISHTDFRYERLSVEQCAMLYQQSSIILDICDKDRKGITTRFYEALASGCKVVTNNENVKEEAIYSPELVYVVSDDFAIDTDNPFFSESHHSKPDLHPYTLDAWLKGFFHGG